MTQRKTSNRTFDEQKLDANLNRFYKIAQEQRHGETVRLRTLKEEVDIEKELARREQIRNDDAEQDIALKRKTLNRLFWFLAAETVGIFALAFLQAVHKPWNFALQEWSFKLLVTVTIAQITAMLFAAVRYLFPKSRR